jgi:hypothetical protein
VQRCSTKTVACYPRPPDIEALEERVLLRFERWLRRHGYLDDAPKEPGRSAGAAQGLSLDEVAPVQAADGLCASYRLVELELSSVHSSWQVTEPVSPESMPPAQLPEQMTDCPSVSEAKIQVISVALRVTLT